MLLISAIDYFVFLFSEIFVGAEIFGLTVFGDEGFIGSFPFFFCFGDAVCFLTDEIFPVIAFINTGKSIICVIRKTEFRNDTVTIIPNG